MALQKSLLPVAQDSTQTLPPAAARDLTNTVIQRIQASLDHSVSDNTRKMYASAWRAFQSWTRARGILALPALMTAGRWKSAKMPARYTERQAADRGAVTKYYQER